MAMEYRSTRTPGKNHPPTPVNREQWGTAPRPYNPEINNHQPTDMTEGTMVVHPHTGVSMTGPEFIEEVREAKEAYGCWPIPGAVKPSDDRPEIKAALMNVVLSCALPANDEKRKSIKTTEGLTVPTYPSRDVVTNSGSNYY